MGSFDTNLNRGEEPHPYMWAIFVNVASGARFYRSRIGVTNLPHSGRMPRVDSLKNRHYNDLRTYYVNHANYPLIA